MSTLSLILGLAVFRITLAIVQQRHVTTDFDHPLYRIILAVLIYLREDCIERATHGWPCYPWRWAMILVAAMLLGDACVPTVERLVQAEENLAHPVPSTNSATPAPEAAEPHRP